jgi:uncharacterized delta-60 repeat protein
MKGNNMKRNIVWQIGLTIVLVTSIIIGAGCGGSGGGGSGSSTVYEAVGIIDNTFGISGVVTTTISTTSTCHKIAIQTDGKIIASGVSNDSSTNAFALSRYTASGALDTSFGTGGIVTTTIGTNAASFGLALQANNRIVVGGQSDTHFVLARYTSTGALDDTFGISGVVTTTLGTNACIDNLVIQPDGKIVAVGWCYDGSKDYFAIARYTTAGALDTTFDTDGVVTTTIGIDCASYDLAIQPDGKMIAGGYAFYGSDYYFAAARYTSTGALDTSFSTDGVITTVIGTILGSIDDECYGLAIQPDGKIILGGYTYDDNSGNYYNAVARYTAAGALDTTFAVGGVFTQTIGSYTDIETSSIAFQSNGKILVSGYANNGSNLEFLLSRLNINGTLDTTFNTDGVITATIGADSTSNNLKIQPNGYILVGGCARYSSNQFALMRFK